MKDRKFAPISMSASSKLRSFASAKLNALYEATGRILSGEKSEITDCPGGKFSAHQNKKIEKMLYSIKPLDGDGGWTLFRGQKLKSSEEPPDKKRLGPPSDEKANSQRYSIKGKSVLYLSESLAGVKRELLPVGTEEKLWGIRFKVPATSLRIANLCDVDGALNDLMFRCEKCFPEGEQPNGYPSQDFSREVARILATHFDGFQAFGVRGDKNFRYKNIVLFNFVGWEDWCGEPFKIDY